MTDLQAPCRETGRAGRPGARQRGRYRLRALAVVGSVFSSIFGARLVDTAFAATGKAAEAADSAPVAFRIAAGNPGLLAAAQDSFLSGLAVACTVVAGLCYAAAVVGMVALPGRRFQPPFSTSAEQLESAGMA